MAGVAAGVAARVTTSVATGVAFISLVVLRYLDTLLDVIELNANSPVTGHTVDGSWWAVVGRNAVGGVGSSGLVCLILDLVLQDNVLDLVQ